MSHPGVGVGIKAAPYRYEGSSTPGSFARRLQQIGHLAIMVYFVLSVAQERAELLSCLLQLVTAQAVTNMIKVTHSPLQAFS